MQRSVSAGSIVSVPHAVKPVPLNALTRAIRRATVLRIPMIMAAFSARGSLRRGFETLLVCSVVLACGLLAAGPPVRAAAVDGEVRALWVTRESLRSPQDISQMVRSAAASGFNTLLVQVRGRGDAYYASRVEPRAEPLASQPSSFDPLATVIALAREHGLRVHAWLNVNLVWSAPAPPAAASHVVHRRPEWLMVPRELAPVLGRQDPHNPDYVRRLLRWTRATGSVEGLYVSPIHEGAAAHFVELLEQLAAMYPLDGIHLDYVRYPSAQFDYSQASLREFRRDLEPGLTVTERRLASGGVDGLLALTERHRDRWAAFRRARLERLVARSRNAVKRQRPGLLLSVAVYPDPAEAASQRLQDWQAWVQKRLVDVVCPMAYTPDAVAFASQIASVRQVSAGQPVWAGIGAYRLSSSETVQNIHAARRIGVEGIVLFSYDSVTRSPQGPEYLSSVGRAAFSR